jgi:hypothetical protein
VRSGSLRSRGLARGRAGSTPTRWFASPHLPSCSHPPVRRRSTPTSHAAARDPPHRSEVEDSEDPPHRPPRTLCSALRSHAAARDPPHLPAPAPLAHATLRLRPSSTTTTRASTRPSMVRLLCARRSRRPQLPLR